MREALAFVGETREAKLDAGATGDGDIVADELLLPEERRKSVNSFSDILRTVSTRLRNRAGSRGRWTCWRRLSTCRYQDKMGHASPCCLRSRVVCRWLFPRPDPSAGSPWQQASAAVPPGTTREIVCHLIFRSQRNFSDHPGSHVRAPAGARRPGSVSDATRRWLGRVGRPCRSPTSRPWRMPYRDSRPRQRRRG